MNSSNFLKYIIVTAFIAFTVFQIGSCNFLTHRTLSNGAAADSTNDDPEPDYGVTLNDDYQNFTSYFYPGNRVENFTSYFNTFFEASKDYDDAFDEYKATLISEYNKRLDSLGIVPPVSASVKEKLNKSIERASKIIQFHKNSKYIDNAVLIIGKSYYFLGDYLNAERKFTEFLSKLSTSDNADEAILFLGRTKIRLGKKDEGKKILENLLANTTDREIKSLTVRDLGVLEFNSGNVDKSLTEFKASVDYSDNSDRKAEGQFIYAKILSKYKPQLSAEEYKKALDYSSDFDLTFYSRLNYAKGLVYNKDFTEADDILENMRKKYRDFPGYTPLVDLEIANSYFGQNKINEAKEKYFEVIIKYPSTASAADAYYYIAKYEETANKNYLKALVNYKKSVETNSTSDFNQESRKKIETFEKYFNLLGEVDNGNKAVIPSVNDELEAFRIQYNEERGIAQPPPETISNENNQNQNQNGPQDDGSQKGKGKGKPGGSGIMFYYLLSDSLKEKEGVSPTQSSPTGGDPTKGAVNKKEENLNQKSTGSDSLNTARQDSLKFVQELTEMKSKEEKKFNAYFELAEIFIYNINQPDSAEYYLKLILNKFTESTYRAKVLYTLANFYKNNNRKTESEDTFKKVISDYPNTVFAYEARKILGIYSNEDQYLKDPVDELISNAFILYNQKKYPEAISSLIEVQKRFPNDSNVAKSLYGIGFIYENNLFNKDSTVYYYKLLREKFPASEYTAKIIPKLDYIASVEVKDTVSKDSTSINSPDTTAGNQGEIKENNSEEVKADTTNVNGENRLSQEEIDKLLKESTEQPTGQPTEQPTGEPSEQPTGEPPTGNKP